jgi:D-glycero-alpha-D-manno-heptose-7-phosphate kinase
MAKNEKLFCSNYEMALRAGEILRSNSDLDEFGEMFRQAWSLKAQMNDKAVTDELNEIYELGIEKGALGGKVLGAGGGGFMMFWIKSDDRERFVSEMKGVTVIPIRIESSGTTTVFSDVDNSVGG